MSIYQRGENWYIDFTFKGQRVRESIGPSKRDAQKVIDKRKTAIVENKYLDIRKDPDPISFHEFAKEYLQWSRANKKPSTVIREKSSLRLWDEEFKGKTMQEITAWSVDKWKLKAKEKKLTANTVKRYLALLKHVFSKAAELGKIKEDPLQSVKFPKGLNKRLRFLMPDEIQILLSNCDERIKPMVIVALHTGMRRGETLDLKKNQIDMEQGFITLLDTKNQERRDIPMDETVKALVKEFLKTPGEYLFANTKGKRTHVTIVHHLFHEALKKSGIDDFHWHDLRHTFASNLIMQEGVELNDVRELLGHKKIDMTLRYAHLSPKHKSRVINVLDRVMSQNPPQAAQEDKKIVNLTR